MHVSSTVVLHHGASARLLNYLLIPAGFTTVLAISFHVFGWIPLHVSAPFLVAPVVLAKIGIGFLFPGKGRVMLMGWLFGIAAVALYDISRIPFIIAGWNDFVPRVGCWVFQSETTPGICGYVWRYFGNGGGMGMSFMLLVSTFELRRKLVPIGITYGLFIYSNLVLTLLAAPRGEELMFELTPLSCFGSFVGHVIYGLALGYSVKCYLTRKSP